MSCFDDVKSGGHRQTDNRCSPTRKGSLISLFFKTKDLANRLRGPAKQRKTVSLLHRRRGREPRVKVHRHNHCYSPVSFVATLGSILPDDWCRTWTADRTIILRRTSKRVKEVVDKMCLTTVVHLTRSFWDDTRNDTSAEKLQFGYSAQRCLTSI